MLRVLVAIALFTTLPVAIALSVEEERTEGRTGDAGPSDAGAPETAAEEVEGDAEELRLFEGRGRIRVESGPLSVYRPGDGHNPGILACGGETFTDLQVHVAHRRAKYIGCGTKVMVCVEETGACVLTRFMDVGPFGVVRGRNRNARREGRWKLCLPPDCVRPPAGWRWRGLADLSHGLWVRLGRPSFLSKVTLVYGVPR